MIKGLVIKGLVITPPVIGRISISKVVEKDGKRLPQKVDHYIPPASMRLNNSSIS
jgi:hypothetical protein